MKVTVTFGATAVVVPCKGEWTVRELIDQANQRYRKILEQNGEDFLVRTHRMEYCDGGILDLDDLLTDLVEDRDKLVAVFEAQELQRGATVSPAGSGGGSTGHSSPYSDPDPYERQPPYFQPPRGGEIEVNAYTLKANTPLLVRSSSDSALAPPLEIVTPPLEDLNARPAETDASHALTNRREPKDRLRLDIPITAKMSRVTLSPLTETVELSGEQGPLGIHVVPYSSSLSGRTLGLHIKGIEANSRSKREGIFREDECIVQINGTELMDKTFAQSQEVFRQAMCSPLVRLEILPLANKQRYEKRLIGQLFTDGHDSIPKAKSPLMIQQKMDAKPEVNPETVKPEQINPKLEPRRPDLHVLRSKNPDLPASLTPLGEHQTGHVPVEMPFSVSPAPVVRDRDGASPTAVGGSESPLPRGKSPTGLPNLANLTNQKGGRKLKIDLKKGTEGLGFTVVTRASTVHGPGPILIKNILPQGAAIKDGRLQPGDRILEVNGVDMTDRTQEELVAMLRSTKQGDCVSVVVVRQEDLFLPRELKGEEASPLVLEDGREQLMFEVPLNDTGSAGLGISLKGNKSREKGEDLGIFIKSIIHGGAAYKDGRLRVNDQLIAVNGEALLGRSNHVAMETLRHSMSWEGNARGTIQLVLLRPAPSSGSAHNTIAQESQEAASHQVPDGPSGPPALAAALESHHHSNGPSPQPPNQPPMVPNNIYSSFRAPPTNGGHAHYEEEEEMEEDFPSPPSPGSVEEMNSKLQYTTQPHRSEWKQAPKIPEGHHPDTKTAQLPGQIDNPQTRNSKSMDLVADESNMRSLAEQRPESSSRGSDLGPTLGLWKSCSLESLQSAVSEARQLSQQSQVPFHRPRPHMVRGRGCNQSFRAAIDKSYDGPSEPEDDDLSEQSSGRDTPVSGSSRLDQIESEAGKKKKKTKGKKKEKKSKEKVKKKTEDSEDQEKKGKKKGFGLLRFGKKKEEKSKAEVKAAKQKLEAVSEEELNKIEEGVRHELRYMEVRDGHVTPDPLPPDLEDDDHDPNYARINTFREPPKGPSPSYLSRTPSPQRALGGPPPGGPSHSRQPSAEDLEGLYAKVNKQRAPASTSTAQLQPPPSDSVQKRRRELQQARAAPAYEELEAIRRRALDHDPPRMAVRGPDPGPAPRYEDVERQYAAHSRRTDPNDYPTQSRTAPGYPGRENYYPPREAQPRPSSLPRVNAPAGPPQVDPRYYQTSPHRAAQRQDVPPAPGTRAPRYETVGRGGYRDASPGRFASPERHDDGYRDDRQPDPRQKNSMIGAV